MKSILRILTLVFFGSVIFVACVDREFDEPEFPFKDPDIKSNSTIKAIKSKHAFGAFTKIEEDLILKATVIANDSTGNFYKKIVVQDSTGGIEVLIDGRDLFSKFPVGRRVFIKAKGLVMNDYNKLIQLGFAESEGSLSPIPVKIMDDYIVGGSLKNYIQPKVVKIGQFTADDISTLVKLYDVQFDNSALGSRFADGTNKTDANRTIVDCSKKEFILRSSGYAKFANDTLPSLNGELTCVLGIYKTDYQGFIRSLKDINFKNGRCGTSSGNETLVTIKSLRDLYASGQKNIADKTKIKGVVISDKSANNLDGKNVVIQDASAGIVVRFDGNHSFNLNDEIEVAVSKLEMSEYSKLLQIANVSVDFAKKVGSSSLTPREATVKQILANTEAWESTLVFVKSISFTGGSIYKDKIYIKDGVDSINLFTRSAATFATNAIPSSKANITAIVGQFNDTYQLSIRNPSDVQDGGTNPTTEIFKDDFETGLGKWKAISEKGAEVWVLDTQFGNPGSCAKMSGYANSKSNENEDWLISPKLDLTGITTAALFFDNATKFDGNALEVLISKNYSGTGSPATATWTTLAYTKSPGNFNYVSSGKIDLSTYNNSNIYIAFKYTSTNSASATWEIDNVKVVK
ncbi:MAG: DUF5689 domain-containing protein [Deltaproteobacteria bacterium]